MQYPGAVYHVMARGDRREAIFRDDDDRKMFLAALSEACGRTGWKVHAYVLMGNHYHLVIETPEPNLVLGMSWLQNTYTRRFNVRHGLWGHLFGGRYKAVAVDERDEEYFRILVDYVHLNAARAGLVGLTEGLEAFPWSSLAAAYIKPVRGRGSWMEVARALRAHRFEDTSAGRKGYLAYLEARVRTEGEQAGRLLPEGQSLQATLKRGWYFGGEAFRERLLDLAQKALKAKTRQKNFGAAPELKDHAEKRAAALVSRGMELCALAEADLLALPRGDERKVLIALAVKRETTVPLDWIAQRLDMGTRSTVSREVGDLARRLPNSPKWRKIYAEVVNESSS